MLHHKYIDKIVPIGWHIRWRFIHWMRPRYTIENFMPRGMVYKVWLGFIIIIAMRKYRYLDA